MCVCVCVCVCMCVCMYVCVFANRVVGRHQLSPQFLDINIILLVKYSLVPILLSILAVL